MHQGPGEGIAGFETCGKEGVEPRGRFFPGDDLVEWPIKGNSCPESPQGPQFLRFGLALGDLFEDPSAQFHLISGREIFKVGQSHPNFELLLTAQPGHAFRGQFLPFLVGCRQGWQEILANVPLLPGGQAPRYAPPENPPFRAALSLPGEVEPLRVDFPELFYAPFIEGRAKAGSHTEAEQIQPAGFMVPGEGATLFAFAEGVGEFTDE